MDDYMIDENLMRMIQEENIEENTNINNNEKKIKSYHLQRSNGTIPEENYEEITDNFLKEIETISPKLQTFNNKTNNASVQSSSKNITSNRDKNEYKNEIINLSKQNEKIEKQLKSKIDEIKKIKYLNEKLVKENSQLQRINNNLLKDKKSMEKEISDMKSYRLK